MRVEEGFDLVALPTHPGPAMPAHQRRRRGTRTVRSARVRIPWARRAFTVRGVSHPSMSSVTEGEGTAERRQRLDRVGHLAGVLRLLGRRHFEQACQVEALPGAGELRELAAGWP